MKKNMLFYLTYFSKATDLMTEENLTFLLKQSRKYNKEQQLTGMLLYVQGRFIDQTEGRFIQVLEGSEVAVEHLFAKIEHDSRHKQVMVLQRSAIPERCFPEWQMGFESLSLNENRPNGFFKLDKSFFEVAPNQNNGRALDLLKMFYQTHLDFDT